MLQKNFLIIEDLANAVLNYVATKPYMEVARMVNDLQNLKQHGYSTPKQFIIEENMAMGILNYLATKPYVEVSKMINAMQMLTCIDDQNKTLTASGGYGNMNT